MTLVTHQRINITLPEPTIRLLNQVSVKGDRSRLIDQAVHFYVETHGRTKLKKLLREGAKQRATRDLALAGEWFKLNN